MNVWESYHFMPKLSWNSQAVGWELFGVNAIGVASLKCPIGHRTVFGTTPGEDEFSPTCHICDKDDTDKRINVAAGEVSRLAGLLADSRSRVAELEGQIARQMELLRQVDAVGFTGPIADEIRALCAAPSRPDTEKP